jgi:hypothetical protein
MENLLSFLDMSGLPETDKDLVRCLEQSDVKEVRMFVLGPEGTNINQAARIWARSMGIVGKTRYRLFASEDGTDPVLSYAMKAREVTESGVLVIFWTCAVYFRLNELFFTLPDTAPLFISQSMDLDSMRLCVKPRDLPQVTDGRIPEGWRVASHPSPTPLVGQFSNEVVASGSNASAARSCAKGEVEACITTESAQRIYNLADIHIFGSPPMIFFGGITASGVKILRELFTKMSNKLSQSRRP